MDHAVTTRIMQCPLIIRVAWSPTAPLLKIIAGPDVFKSGIIFDPGIKVLEIASLSILECSRHVIKTSLLRLDHRLGFGSITSRTRTPRDIDDLHINFGMGCLKHIFEMLDTRDRTTSDWIDTVFIRFANQQ